MQDTYHYLEQLEAMEPEEIDAMLAPPKAKKRQFVPSLPKISNPLNKFWGWYDALDYWDRRSLESNLELIGFMAMPLVFFGVVGLSVNGLPGQFRGAYQWASTQETPTKIDFCQNHDFGIKRCRFSDKNGDYGYVQSDNGSEWRNILDD